MEAYALPRTAPPATRRRNHSLLRSDAASIQLNPTAALVVEKLQKGRSVSEIAQVIADVGFAAPEQASEWVDATLAALKEQTRVDEAAPAPADPEQISDLLPYAPFKPVTEQRYCLLETCALIRYEAWAQKRLVELSARPLGD